ncbi:MAG: sigma-70 family RNA polymerase sigma factor [candidate division WOR-3 bacterium]
MGRKELSTLSDGELVRRAQSGDLAAFEAIYDRYHPRLYRLLYGMLNNPADAADLTQEVFLRAYSDLERLRPESNLYGWLRKTAVNLGIDQLRRQKVLKFESLDVPLENEEGSPFALQIEDVKSDPHTLLEQRGLQEAVQKALGYLTPDHRAVVAMHYLEGMEVEEIASLVGVPVGTVKSRLARARNALRRYLAPYVEG